MKSSPLFEELDYRQTPMGELILRRRRLLTLKGMTVYEVKLGERYLMSSLFYASEQALADIGLGGLGGSGWDVAVGGLGLGYTAAAALKYEQVKRLVVIEAFQPVIDWHTQELVPNGHILNNDPRCVFYQADFFALARGNGFDPAAPGHRFDAVLLDIDHSPGSLLDAGHGDFYTAAGFKRVKSFLRPGGVFALWSNDPPQAEFIRILSGVFDRAEGRTVEFDNPLQQSASTNGIYVARC
ncbi:MAG: spermidine synthase [Desulfobacterales bacterium]|nr:spermidine synthase [Desulfobacterales bacterium]